MDDQRCTAAETPQGARRGARGEARRRRIGANDVDYSTYEDEDCTADECYRDGVAAMESNVTHILDRVKELRAGRPTKILLVDYWNVWADGQVGAGEGTTYVRVSNTATS